MAEEYVIGLSVTGGSQVESAASSVDGLDDSLAAVSDEARNVASTMGKSISEAKQLTREFEGLDKATLAVADHYGDMASQFATFGGPVGNTVARFYELGEAYKKLSLFAGKGTAIFALASAGIVALGVAAVAATVAVVAMGAALVGAAISASDAANNVSILREGMTGSAAAAEALTGTINKVSKSVPISVAEVGKLADGLYKAGKRGADLEKALLEASYEAAGLGKNPGPVLIAKKMASLGVIGSKLKDNIAEIFSGATTKNATLSFGKELSGFTELFGQNHSEGRALQKLLSVLVDPLINGLTSLIPLATAAFRGMILMALDIAIAVVEAKNAIIKMIPDEVKDAAAALAGKVDLVAAAMVIGKTAAVVLAGVFVVIAGVFAAVVVVLGAMTAGFFGAVTAAYKLASAVLGAVASAGEALLSFGKMGTDAAANMVAGLVAGIQAGVGAVVAAIKSMAGSAVAAIESALKIGSPSKIFEDLGGFTGEGFVVGIEGETAQVQSSLETMVSPPSIDTPPSPMRAPGGGDSVGGGKAVDLSGATFNFYGVKDTGEGVSQFEEALTRVFEGDALAVGAA